MTDFYDQIAALPPKRLALLALELKERLDASDDRLREPIAIVGLGCRFPGADSPAALAQLLRDGVDAIREVPPDRWDIDAYYDPDPDVPGRMNTRYGGFLDGIDQFDPAHFGISPREASGMDPQQRLVLEVAWEALEHAGIAPDRVTGSQTGVFLGISTLDYPSLMLQAGDSALDLYSSSGGSHAVAAGRVSYILGLHGPALAIDTACSSSLVAVHLACQSLRAAECDTALAAGVNVICAPETTLMLSRARMMAPDGRCKTFDARADGFVRGEGCGVLVLRRLSVAQAAGDRILAVIRGSAVNQDGRSSGLTAPNGPAQEAVIRAALANAGVAAASVSYVEAHGTGTSLGDPIELRALGAVYGAGRNVQSALVTSSLKTNFGHLEAAAGVAGLAKTVLALQHERIPAHLHAESPTPHVDWSTLGVRLPARGGEAWTRSDAPRRAGVSSFGFSGTNAHVILEEAPATLATSGAVAGETTDRLCLLPLAARTTGAVRQLAGRYAAHLDADPAARLSDLCASAAMGRAQFAGSRAAILTNSVRGATEGLSRLAAGDGPAVHEQLERATILAADAVVGETTADVALIFTGQGGAHPEMGRSLFDGAPVFRDAMTRLDAPFRHSTGVSLLAVLYGDAPHEFTRPEVSAAALVAFQIALAELWRSWGVEPAVVAGHSLGEYAAAVTAGAMREEDALRLVAARGRAVGGLPAGHGAMAIVDASLERIGDILGEPIGAPSALEIAAINAPEQVVLAGPVDHIERAEARLLDGGVRVRRLKGIDHAYHSAQLESLLPAYLEVCRGTALRAPSIEWVSCLTGDVQSASEPVDPAYWTRQMREPVQWRKVVRTIGSRGARVLIEIGPTAVLSGLSRASLEADGVMTAVSVPSLRNGVPAWSTMLEAVGRGWVRGMTVDWSRLMPADARRLALPTYPFQRQRYWLSPGRSAHRIAGPTGGGVLGSRLHGPVPSFAVPISEHATDVVRAHVVHGRPLFAGSAFLDAALLALAQWRSGDRPVLRDIRFLAPLEVGRDDREAVLTIEPRDDGAVVGLSSIATGAPAATPWVRHAIAHIGGHDSATPAVAPVSLPTLTATLPEAIDHDGVYAAFAARGITLGRSVRAIHSLRRRDGEALARLVVPDGVRSNAQRAALLDGALQAFGVASPQFSESPDGGPARVLAQIGSARVTGDMADIAWCHATITADAPDAPWSGTLRLLDLVGGEVAVFEALTLIVPQHAAEAVDAFTYRLAWEPAPLPDTTGLPTCAALATVAAERLVALGAEHRIAEYDTLIPRLETTALHYASEALTALGIDGAEGEVSDAALRDVVRQHWPLVRRLARALASGSETHRTNDTDVDSLGGGEMELLHRCGSRLAGVLRGTDDPLQLLFPGGSFDALDRIYRDSAFARTYNGAMRDVVRAEVARRGGAPLSILEIGAGTGGTTGFVLDAVPSTARYLFTDVSPLFLERARERLHGHTNLEFRLLDIERNPAAQGFPAHGFDLIIASNVLHATTDVQQTLAHVHALAAPGALVLLMEGTAPLHWVDLTFGLTEGWWRFTDRALRPAHPLISADQWVQQLSAAGFMDAWHAQPTPARAFTTQSLIFARRAAEVTAVSPTLIYTDASGIGDALTDRLAARGIECAVVRRDAGDLESAVRALTSFRHAHSGGVNVVYLWALDLPAGVADNDIDQGLATLLSDEAPRTIMRAMASPGADARLWLATRGAQSVGEDDAVVAPEQAPLWGWARGFALEHPHQSGACIDLDPAHTVDAAARAIEGELREDVVEDQVAFRGDVRTVARLVHARAPAHSDSTIRKDGAYLITGGTGGIGLRVAQWLADNGAGEVVLMSRSGSPDDPADTRHAALRALRESRTTVHVVQADAGDAEALASVLARFGNEWGTLRGVVHAAVAMSAAPIADLSEAECASMRRSKVDGSRLLHRLTLGHALDFFVVFSSTTSLLGVHGMAHYAAANQYLDALALHRRTHGQVALSVAWGTWDVMRVATSEDQAMIARGGLRQLHSATALELLDRLIASGVGHAVVADVDWRTLVPLYEARRPRPMISALAAPDAVALREPVATNVAGLTAIDTIRAAGAAQRALLLEQLVRNEVAAVLGYANGDGIPADRGFFELGLDSLMSVELKRRLEAAVRQSLPSTLTFNYPNVLALVAFLQETLFVAPVSASAGTPASLPTPGVAAGPSSHDDLSDDQLESELLARLERLR